MLLQVMKMGVKVDYVAMKGVSGWSKVILRQFWVRQT